MARFYPYSRGCIAKTSYLKKIIDEEFKDLPQVWLPLFVNTLVEEKVNPKTGKEVYRAKGQVIRYDLTNNLIECDLPLPATRCYGVVARDGPTTGYRWKQFYQYDLDSIYELYGMSLLRRGITVLQKIFPEEQLVMKYFGLNKEELLEWPCEVKYEEFRRDHLYYTNKVFQVSFKSHPTVTLLGGGSYKDLSGTTRVGYSFGITRLTFFVRKRLLEPKVLCYVVQGQPKKLLSSNHRNCFFPVKCRKSLSKDYPRIVKDMEDMGYYPSRTIIHGKHEEQTGKYRYKEPGGKTEIYSIDALVGLVCTDLK